MTASVASTSSVAAISHPHLNTLHAVVALTNAQAASDPPATFEATVTYFYGPGADMDVQEDEDAIFVRSIHNVDLHPGDRVLVQGLVEPSFLPYVVANHITVLRHGALPLPVAATFDDLVHAHLNCRLVRVRGSVRVGELVDSPRAPRGRVELLMDGGYIDLEVQSNDRDALRNLMDADVEVIGATGRRFDGKMRQIAAKLKVSSLADIRVLSSSRTNPWRFPLTPFDAIITGYHIVDQSQRLHVRGTVTYYQPGTAAVLQSASGSLWVSILSTDQMRIGDIADATGFPDTHDGQLTLTHAEIRDSGVLAPVSPQSATWSQLAAWQKNRPGGHENDLVSTEGRVVTAVREATQDEYVLVANGRLFTAVYRHPSPSVPLPPMLEVPLGSSIRITGICMITGADSVNEEAPFDILLRSFDDVKIVARPSMLNVRNLLWMVGVLVAGLLVAGFRSWTMERKVRRETAILAFVERRRRRILEDINGSLPLPDTLMQITEMISFRLHGAPCWIENADGSLHGSRPPTCDNLRTASEPIASRLEAPHGSIFAAFDSVAKPVADEGASLALGAGLAALAMETSRLHSDLVRRSEFDQLTDVRNRFSLEKRLDAFLDEAGPRASCLGLIYIDLDEFKKVNDQFGHRAGDLYLQEAARRMKQQLRPDDLLARLGGDEFAVLVPMVRNRSEVEEIALRLERCFENPFIVDNVILDGSASVGIAVYPADAATKDGLLSAADAAMYSVKRRRSKARLKTQHVRALHSG
jgi:diguanylate cyclase (GGDEF)-like protein